VVVSQSSWSRTIPNQTIKLRGSADFSSIRAYRNFIDHSVDKLNKRCEGRLAEEQAVLMTLPSYRFVDYSELTVKVTTSSTLSVKRVLYTVPSRLVGEDELLYQDRYVGKQGRYDVYQHQSKVPGEKQTSYLFTAEDDQLVLVEPISFGRRIWRNIAPDIAIGYSFFPEIGTDFIQIDKVVADFIKAHLQSKPIVKE